MTSIYSTGASAPNQSDYSKVCSKCDTRKHLTSYGVRKDRDIGYRSQCKSCDRKQALDYLHTKKGLVSKLINKQRASSKQRGHPKPAYSNKELLDWCQGQDIFHTLFSAWEDSGFEKDLTPSIDRIDDYKPYSIDNIQLMTWRENREKFYQDQISGVNTKRTNAVKQLDFDGNLVAEYFYAAQAQRETGIHAAGIGAVCAGKVKKQKKPDGTYKYVKSLTAGGYKWQYA